MGPSSKVEITSSIAAFDNDGFSVKVCCCSSKFRVSTPPDDTSMVVDGMKLTKREVV